MKISEVFQSVRQKMPGHEADHLSLEVLLAHAIQKTREFLLAHPEFEVPEEQERFFLDLFERFYAGEPVAYLTGTKEFFGLPFAVDRRVLIPRPETELMVEKVLSFAETRGKEKPLQVLDVGTGSGCIAVSIAKSLPCARVTATDVSEDALKVALHNASTHGVNDRVTFVCSDLLDHVDGSFDVVVANLPYIGEERHRYISREALMYEPHVALFGGTDGLRLYERLFDQMSLKGWKPELFLGEFGFLQGEEMRLLLDKFFVQGSWGILKDYASIERMFVIRSH